jgi:hydrogenase small subunit
MSDQNSGRSGARRDSAQTLGEMFSERGVSRRSFLKFASYTASIMALPPTAATALAEGLANARRQSVIWLSFQECTGCTESITRASSPSIEDLIFDFISLDYHHTLQNARRG